MFGPKCKFISTRISDFTGLGEVIEELIRSILGERKHKANFLSRTRAASFPKEKKGAHSKDKQNSAEGRSSSVKEHMMAGKQSTTTSKPKKVGQKNDAQSAACAIS